MKYYKFKPEGKMNCEVKLFASKEIYENIEETAIKQLINASKLPGVVGVVGLPDTHQGYGLPIGGVMACDLQQGVVSPGAVGFDINCGVRLLTTKLTYSDVEGKLESLIEKLKSKIPAGLGKNSKFKFKESDFKQIIEKGLPFLIKDLEYGTINDLDQTEELGCIKGANSDKVSDKAIKRGKTQLGTLGSGNHFLEIQRVDKIFTNKESQYPALKKDQLVFMIHTGSRGFGHQIAQDYINLAKQNNFKYNFDLPTKNLAAFPISSEEGQDYLKAMACAANFAFANRQIITHQLRKIVTEFFQTSSQQLGLTLYYDLAHNIVKEEKDPTGKSKRNLLIHRKGATQLKKDRIALIPGSMGTASYIVEPGAEETTSLSFHSVAHGAGRKMGRRQAKRSLSYDDHLKSLGAIKVLSGSGDNLLDESPLAYKNIDQVIASLIKTGLAKPVAKLKPLAVLKG